MKISSIQCNSRYINNFPVIKPLHLAKCNKKELKFKGVDNSCYPIFDLNTPTYDYKPIAGVEANFELVGNYDDLDKFCELFASKVNSQLMAPTREDIENLINRIQFKTKASRKQIKEVLYNLTAFSSYKALDKFSEITDKNDIECFGFNHQSYDSIITDSQNNSAIDYLMFEKGNYKRKGNKIGLILDNQTLSSLEHLKNSSNSSYLQYFYRVFTDKIKKNEIVFISPKSWEIKTKNNGYKSANFLTGSGYLESLAIETINNLKSGIEENEIYYSDFKERLYELTKEDVDKDKLKIVEVEPDERSNIEISDILDNITPKTISKEKVKATIKSYAYFKEGGYKEENIIPSFLKYLDSQTHLFSIDSLALNLKKLHEKIKESAQNIGADKENLCYIIPEENKSFSLISAMYASINSIAPQNINYTFCVPEENRLKTKVILDDISASGVTEKRAISHYRSLNGKAEIIYAPIILCKKAKTCYRDKRDYPSAYSYNFILEDLSRIEDLIDLKTSDNENTNGTKVSKSSFDVLNKKDLKNILYKLDRNFDSMGLSVMFPYMIPDNASDLASLMFRDLLYCNNLKTNKPFYYYKAYNQIESMERYNNIYKYAQNLISSEKA